MTLPRARHRNGECSQGTIISNQLHSIDIFVLSSVTFFILILSEQIYYFCDIVHKKPGCGSEFSYYSSGHLQTTNDRAIKPFFSEKVRRKSQKRTQRCPDDDPEDEDVADSRSWKDIAQGTLTLLRARHDNLNVLKV